MDTLRQLKNSYQEKEAIDMKDSFFMYFVYRPLSFYLAVPFVWTGLSANQISLVDFTISLASIFCFAVGGYAATVAGGLLRFVATVVDLVDGNIARFRGQASHFGKFIDGLIDTFIVSLIPLAVSFGLYARPDRVLVYLGERVDPRFVLMTGALASFAILFQVFLTYRLQAARLELQVSGKEVLVGPPSSGTAVSLRLRIWNRAVYMLGRLLNFEHFFMLGFIGVFALFNIMSIFLLVHLLARSMQLFITSVRSIVQARRDLDAYRPY